MSAVLKFTILGCGSSPGVPRPNGDWGACDPKNPKNQRHRASLLIERIQEDGKKTTVVIDTGPDFREQMIMAKVTHLDGIVYTHAHADHIHGIDDVRTYAIQQQQLLNTFADGLTLSRLHEAFGYCFKTPPGSHYPPIMKAHEIDKDVPFTVTGEGGEIVFHPHLQIHGDINSLGFRIGNVAYCTDVNLFPDETPDRLKGLDVLIIDALQYKPHPSHFSLNEALEWIERLKPKRAILTHMHVPLDYETVKCEVPAHIEPGYDGLSFITAA